jgi:cyclase
MRNVDELILLDIDATAKMRGPDIAHIRRVADFCDMPLTVGGGVSTVAHARDLLAAGADKVAVCSEAMGRPELIAEIADACGSQAVVVSIDINDDGQVRTHCGNRLTHWSLEQILSKAASRGAGEILLQSISRDGEMCGYDLDAIAFAWDRVTIPLIASGGCGTPRHMGQALRAGADAVAAGAMFQFTDYTPRDCARALAKGGVKVRGI